MPLIATRGAASVQGFGEFAQTTAPVYIEDVFSTWLYTGTGATQTITNNIDLSTKGGLVWTKERTSVAGAVGHQWTDTARGYEYQLSSNSTAAQTNEFNRLTSFNTNGFTLGNSSYVNANTGSWVSWTFREQPKFFDVVTYTGDGNAGRTVSHNLGSVPGCIIVKRTDSTGTWFVYHRSMGNTKAMFLNTTSAEATSSNYWNNTDPTSTNFTLGGAAAGINTNGGTYVAYLFAHDAGGFGLTGSDNVISCGSFTTDGSGNSPVVNLGYEPQWLLVKQSGASGSWYIIDTMRAWNNAPAGSTSALTLYPNLTNGEAGAAYWNPTSTGFYLGSVGNANTAFIYIAIRRGPMKTPTTGTSVFTPVTYTGDAAASKTISTGKNYVTDWLMTWDRTNGTFGTGTGYNSPVITRLTGFDVDPPYLKTNEASSEGASVVKITLNNAQFDYTVSGTSGNLNGSGLNYINWNFGRAPGFFDVVCYTGTGSQRTVSHNLGVVPELIIVKSRNDANDWAVYSSAIGNTKNLRLNTTAAESSALDLWASTTPSATTFTVTGTFNIVNGSTVTYVAYLFASVAGVSKVGSYTGTGTTLQVNCGFTNGSRFVLIKRTDSTGDWYVWDSARGIVAGNDPYIRLNSTAAEVTNTDYVDTFSSGFEISSTAPAAINANGGTFIFLAIA